MIKGSTREGEGEGFFLEMWRRRGAGGKRDRTLFLWLKGFSIALPPKIVGLSVGSSWGWITSSFIEIGHWDSRGREKGLSK